MPKEDGIRIDPERGVNPRMTRCVQCGGDTMQIALLGDTDYEFECPACDIKVLGRKGQSRCPKCKKHILKRLRRLDEFEKIALGLCPTCEENRHLIDTAVRAGGIMWKCSDCHNTGAIVASHALAVAVREKMNIQPPHPCGVEFSNAGCPVCGPDAVVCASVETT